MLYTLGITCRALYKTQSNTAATCAGRLWRRRFLVIDPLVMRARPCASKWHWVWHFLLPRLRQTAPPLTLSAPLWDYFFQCFETSSFKQERKRAMMTTFYPVTCFSYFFFSFSTNQILITMWMLKKTVNGSSLSTVLNSWLTEIECCLSLHLLVELALACNLPLQKQGRNDSFGNHLEQSYLYKMKEISISSYITLKNQKLYLVRWRTLKSHEYWK